MAVPQKRKEPVLKYMIPSLERLIRVLEFLAGEQSPRCDRDLGPCWQIRRAARWSLTVYRVPYRVLFGLYANKP